MIRKAHEAILKTANEFQKAGIDTSGRVMVVGGSRPKGITRARMEKEKKANDPST